MVGQLRCPNSRSEAYRARPGSGNADAWGNQPFAQSSVLCTVAVEAATNDVAAEMDDALRRA